jgi:hypothetical protein
MAKDEMETITEDRWDKDIWGIENGESDLDIPKLIFYFGENVSPFQCTRRNYLPTRKDHWVADHTRDALIAARGRSQEQSRDSRPLMLIDENKIDHGFCIRKCSKSVKLQSNS